MPLPGEKKYQLVEREEDRKKQSEEESFDKRGEATYVAGELGGYVLNREQKEEKPEEETTQSNEYLLENVELPAKAEITLTEGNQEEKFRVHDTNPEDELKAWLIKEWEEKGKKTKEPIPKKEKKEAKGSEKARSNR